MVAERELQRELDPGKKNPIKAKKSKKRRRQGVTGDEGSMYDEDDEDFFSSRKEKKRHEKAKRKEFQRYDLKQETCYSVDKYISLLVIGLCSRRDEGDYLDDLEERNKVFKKNKKELVEKVAECDTVCATRSLLVVINCDHDAIYYNGDQSLVSQFFTVGVSTKMLKSQYNIRMVSVMPQDIGAQIIHKSYACFSSLKSTTWSTPTALSKTAASLETC